MKKIKARRDNLNEIALNFKKVLDSKPLLISPLKGSEDKDISPNLIPCFECSN